MFSKEVTESDAFIDMPLSSQALYFHLWISADDDWFVTPQRILRAINANKNDLDILILKWFCIVFEDWVLVITHWKQNNYLRPDRYTPTQYQKHYKTLQLEGSTYIRYTTGIPLVGVGKVSIGKDRIEKDKDFSFDSWWSLYPLKEWKKKAMEYFDKKIKTQEDYDNLIKWTNGYIAVVKVRRSTGFALAYRQGDVFLNKDTRLEYLDWSVEAEVKQWLPLDKIMNEFNSDPRELEAKRAIYCGKYSEKIMLQAQSEYNIKQNAWFSI